MSRVYTLVNQKGGVGKTTTAISLGAFLARAGQRVLIVDIDPQANATSCLGVDKHTVRSGAYEVLLGDTPAGSVILRNNGLNLSLLPSAPALAGAEVELVEADERESRLKRGLAPLLDRYDYLLIDCPPSLSLLTVNGLIAARDGVIIPVQCEYLALEGLGQLMETLQRVRSGLFPGLAVRGVLMTMFDSRTNLANEVVAEVRKYFPEQMFKTVVPRSIRLAEAPSYGLPISSYAPDSTGAKAYESLAHELLAADGVRVPDDAPERGA
jgi:chromosome partitioning protein